MTTATTSVKHDLATPRSGARLRTAILAGALFVPVGYATMIGLEGLASTLGVIALPGIILGAFAAWLARPWLFLVAGIVIALVPAAVLLGLFGGASIVNPLAAPEFIGSWIAFGGAALALAAGVRAVMHRPAGASEDRRPTIFVIALVALVAGASVTSAMAADHAIAVGAGGGYDIAPDRIVKLETRKFEFTPDPVRIPVGQVVEFQITNADRALHTFTYALNGRIYDHELLPGGTTTFLARFNSPGDIEIWCKPHSEAEAGGGHSGMVGTLAIR